MNETARELLFSSILALEEKIKKNSSIGILEQSYLYWLLDENSPIQTDSQVLLQSCFKAVGANKTYREIAALGYLSEMIPNAEQLTQGINDGLNWLSDRPAFDPAATPSFEVHGVALLGIALAIKNSSEKIKLKSINWMSNFLPKTVQTKIDKSNYQLVSAAAFLINKIEIVPTQTESAESSFAKFALHRKVRQVSDSEINLTLSYLDSNIQDSNLVSCSLKLAAIRNHFKLLATVNLKTSGVEDVVRVLEQLSHGLKLWTWEDKPRTGRKGALPIKWEIENEYHVQNLLWSVLAPVFGDLDDEENLPSSGQVRVRSDLCIRPLELIIEAKFLRDGTHAEYVKIINELAADASLYCVSGSGFTKLIPVIWDNSRTTESYAELISGLEKINSIVKTIIIPRPGKMKKA